MPNLTIPLAPQQLWQAINPLTIYQNGGQIGLINVSIGQTQHPEIEDEILDEVGSYGRQIGRIGDAIEVLIASADRAGWTPEQKDAIAVLEGQLAAIRKIKRQHGR